MDRIVIIVINRNVLHGKLRKDIYQRISFHCQLQIFISVKIVCTKKKKKKRQPESAKSLRWIVRDFIYSFLLPIQLSISTFFFLPHKTTNENKPACGTRKKNYDFSIWDIEICIMTMNDTVVACFKRPKKKKKKEFFSNFFFLIFHEINWVHIYMQNYHLEQIDRDAIRDSWIIIIIIIIHMPCRENGSSVPSSTVKQGPR